MKLKTKRSSIRAGLTNSRGQALVTLLIFASTAIIIITGAIGVILVTSYGTGKFAQGEEVYHIAEAGAENAILRLLRDRTYTGEILQVGNGATRISVSGDDTIKTIISEAVLDDNFRRKIKVTGSITNNSFQISNWTEVE